jgi:hypothetical protein
MVLLLIFLGFCTQIEASVDEEVVPVVGVSRQKIRPLGFPLLFRTREQQVLEEKKQFDLAVSELLSSITQTDIAQRKNHIFIFDVHGVLTTLKDPSDDILGITEKANEKLVTLYHQLKELGATVVISSAWRDMSRVFLSLDKTNIGHFEEIVFTSDEGYDIVHSGNVVSARETSKISNFFGGSGGDYSCKKEAAIWYANQQGVDQIFSITLFDDRTNNLEKFTGKKVTPNVCPLSLCESAQNNDLTTLVQTLSFYDRLITPQTLFRAVLVPDTSI